LYIAGAGRMLRTIVENYAKRHYKILLRCHGWSTCRNGHITRERFYWSTFFSKQQI